MAFQILLLQGTSLLLCLLLGISQASEVPTFPRSADPKHLVRKEVGLQFEDLRNLSTDAGPVEAERASLLFRAGEEAEIVFETLEAVGGGGHFPQAVFATARPPRPTLTQACLLTSKASDTRMFLGSSAFREQVQEGVKFAEDKRLIIAGLWRQVGTMGVKRIFEALIALGSFFLDYHMIMLENDSTDNTKAAVREQCGAEPRATCFLLNGLGAEVLHAGAKNRVRGLTSLRQMLLTKVKEFDPSGLFDFVLMVDGDIFSGGNAGFDIAGALTAFTLTSEKGRKADAVCAYQTAGNSAKYYDTFAHRGPECPYTDLATKPSCPAASCGGGMVVYTRKAIRESGCSYVFEGEKTCEHVPFNECLRNMGFGNILLHKPWCVSMYTGDRSEWRCAPL